MKLNEIRFTKTNGGMARTAEGKDHVSGLIFDGFGTSGSGSSITDNLSFGTDGNVSGFDTVSESGGSATSYAKKFDFPEQLEECGIVHTEYAGTALSATEKAMNTIHYHVTEFFRMNPNGTLYVMIKSGSTAAAAADVADLQNYANGEIRQVGIFSSTLLTASTLQSALSALEAEYKPLSAVVTYSGKNVTLSTLTGADLKTDGQCNISVLVGCDFSPALSNELGDYAYYGCIGACIGAISKAAVHESIAWVEKFPLGFDFPALFNGNLIKNVSTANQELLNENYLFVRTYVGDADCYFNDSHTLDLTTSDYAYIENVRTIDKACRGIRSNMLPYLNSPLQVDAATGKLDAPMVAFLETVAGKALEDMEKAGELSGYSAEIDPNQNVLSTSTVEVVVKNVAKGVMRKVNVKIGFATKL